MNRFAPKKASGYFPDTFRSGHRRGYSAVLPLCIFALIIVLFLAGIRTISDTNSSSQYESLCNALSRSITHCYAVEGQYPPSLEYLEEHYGLTWDHSIFIIDYQPMAANVMPVYSVIPLEEAP